MSGVLKVNTIEPSVGDNVSVNGDCVLKTKTPASAGANGVAGTICWDANYIYICVATNTWKRAALSWT